MNNGQEKLDAADVLLRALQAIIENVDSGLVQMRWTGMDADNAANLDAARAAVALGLREKRMARRPRLRGRVARRQYRAGNLLKNEADPAGYRFRQGVEHAWVKIESLDVHLRRTDEGVVVDLYTETVTDQPIASTYAFFAESAGDPDFKPADRIFTGAIADHTGD